MVGQAVLERKPVALLRSYECPQAESQIVSGVYQLEGGRSRWMSGRATILLKPHRLRSPSVSKSTFPIKLRRDRSRCHSMAFWWRRPGTHKPGPYTVWSPNAVKASGESASLEIAVDRAFSTPGDRRTLGAVLLGAGFADR